ncbi:MAG: hypothetical protein G01um101418_169 [Parcubacteria group bacterium Gr01-1014_18]|nr:MAG: hypothetical protein Greene041636_137 [Parcubacteria group bacterium Greene0416_36]TSC81329.1 MAG: hypothetical protein G01um101418_169 [Parcubacteria group bacterium Gr01-1014_18]TSC99485.1 MAG: hypothetical protein Greene101420_152 [Parcubacteria group bacterium Greene1014_20]TSD07596.1 MAG: hypothetical protein Greene07142_53 [Parcubacteria group bacterium Greene0714_2]
MLKHADQRVGIFVDVSNMYHSAKNLYSARLNFKKVLEEAVGPRKLIRSIAYVVRSNTPEEEAFFDALDKSGFEVKLKELQIFPGGMKKGDWDVGLSMDAIKMASKLDSVILVTGDGDYVPLVSYLKENKGCQVEVVSFSKTTSQKLIEACDFFMDIEERKGIFLFDTKESREGSNAPRRGRR